MKILEGICSMHMFRNLPIWGGWDCLMSSKWIK
jgi:hypothetical protein